MDRFCCDLSKICNFTFHVSSFWNECQNFSSFLLVVILSQIPQNVPFKHPPNFYNWFACELSNCGTQKWIYYFKTLVLLKQKMFYVTQFLRYCWILTQFLGKSHHILDRNSSKVRIFFLFRFEEVSFRLTFGQVFITKRSVLQVRLLSEAIGQRPRNYLSCCCCCSPLG